MDKLPTYELIINPDEVSDVEVSFVALVDKPAIEKNFLAFKEDEFGGPGSGPHPSGEVGTDSSGDTAKILAKPREQRSEQDIKHLLKRKKKSDVKALVDDNKSWIKSNPDKAGTPEHKARVRENNVADRILRGHYEYIQFDINEEKRIISGPAMIADSLIYRRDAQGEYNVFFSAETINQIALKFFKKDYQKNLNLFHDPTLSIEGVTIFESFISDKSRGIPPMAAFKDLPDGTWFISAKIENDAVWEKVKSGEVKGFSVEGIFSYVKKLSRTDGHSSHIITNDSLMDNILDTLNQIKEKFLGNPVPPVAPAAPQVLSTDYTLADGTPVSIDKLEVGGVVLVNGVAAPAGEHELSDGTKIVVGEGGAITEVKPMEAAPAAPDFSSQFAAYDEKFANYETKFEAYETRFTEMGNQLSNANATIVQLVSIVEQLAKAPTADPVGENKGNFTTQKVQLASDKRKTLAESIQALKNKK